jgi:hypothetical protein
MPLTRIGLLKDYFELSKVDITKKYDLDKGLMKFRFLEAFFESAPQCILQLHIIITDGEASKYHLISLGISWITFSWFCATILFPRKDCQRLATFFLIILCSVPRLASWALLTSTSKPYTIIYFIGDVLILAPIMMCLTDMTFPR